MSAYRESCDACMNRKIRDDADGKVQPTRAWHTSTRNRFLAWLIGALVFTFSTAALIDTPRSISSASSASRWSYSSRLHRGSVPSLSFWMAKTIQNDTPEDDPFTAAVGTEMRGDNVDLWVNCTTCGNRFNVSAQNRKKHMPGLVCNGCRFGHERCIGCGRANPSMGHYCLACACPYG